jgi:hypothetical protein
MARIAFAWELGGGMGHIVPYLQLFRDLKDRGHGIYLVLKHLRQADSLTAACGATCFQAPIKTWPSTDLIKTPLTYPHILHNSGFDDLGSLTGLVRGWRSLFNSIQPDLVVFEHSPTALLSARGFTFQKMLIGTGFTIPPPVYPLPNLRFWMKADPKVIQSQEDHTLAIINRLLETSHLPTLARLSDLFASERQVLKTFRELDPYKQRENGNYYGTWIGPIGEEPVWPPGEGKKIFVYLKPFPTLPFLLTTLIDLKMPSIVYIETIGHKLRSKFNSSTLHLVDKPQDISKIAEQCDVAILNGTLNTTINLLLVGKPALHLPLYLEQYLTAYNIEKIGAGISEPTLKPDRMATGLKALLESSSFTDSAERFASRYASFNTQGQRQRLLGLIENMLA